MKTTEHKTLQKVSVLTLVGIVVGSMVGGGVFTLPRSFGSATGVLAPSSPGSSGAPGC